MVGVPKRAIQYVNRLRAAEGLDKLHWDRSLTPGARAHSLEMAGADRIWHSDGDVLRTEFDKAAGPDNWSLGGENVGASGDMGLRALLTAFEASPEHRRNMLRKRYDDIGVGVARRPDGELFMTYWFYG